jgi:hypothetical protein
MNEVNVYDFRLLIKMFCSQLETCKVRTLTSLPHIPLRIQQFMVQVACGGRTQKNILMNISETN